MDHNTLKRIAIAQICAGKSGYYCQHEYIDVNECIERDGTAVDQGAVHIACRICWLEHNQSTTHGPVDRP